MTDIMRGSNVTTNLIRSPRKEVHSLIHTHERISFLFKEPVKNRRLSCHAGRESGQGLFYVPSHFGLLVVPFKLTNSPYLYLLDPS